MLRCDVKRIGERWQLGTGSGRKAIVSSPDRNVILGSAHQIFKKYDGLLTIYDYFHRVEARYAYRDGSIHFFRSAHLIEENIG